MPELNTNLLASIGQKSGVGDTITKAYTLRSLMNQQELQKMTLAKTKQEATDEATYKKLASQHDLSTPQGTRELAADLSKAGLADKAMSVMSQSQQMESGELNNQIQHLQLHDQMLGSLTGYIDPIVSKARNDLASGKDPKIVDAQVNASAAQAVQQIMKDPNIPQEYKAPLLQRIQKGPVGYQDLFNMETSTTQGRQQIQSDLADLKGITEAKKESTMEKVMAQGGKPPAGYEWDPANPGSLIPIKGGPKDPSASGTMTPDAVADAATQYNLTGKLPPLGRGDSAMLSRNKILNTAAQQLKDAGKDEQAAIVGQAALKAGQQAYGAIKKSQTMVGTYEKTAMANMQIVRDTSKKVDRTGSPILNKWILSGRKSIAGDPAVSQFDTAITTLAEEYAKVMSGATGSSAATDSARATAHEMINRAQTPEQLEGVLQTMTQEMNNRMASYDDQLNELQQQMGVKKPTQAPSATTNIDALIKKYGGG